MPSLILMHGLPATGKTTIAAMIAEDFDGLDCSLYYSVNRDLMGENGYRMANSPIK